MKTFRNHILQGFMLLLVLLYSTPIKLLHNCSNLNQHHDGISIQQTHEDCLICELQFYPYIPAETVSLKIADSYPTELYTSLQGRLYHTERNACLNKGPPAVI
jgi:hypothetical protein